MMRKIRKEIAWAAAIWFLFGTSQALGKWLQIDMLSDGKIGSWLWYALGGGMVFAIFLADCTEAVLARIGECNGGIAAGDTQPK